MPRDFFVQRKKAVLFKVDKSSKNSWDKKIIPLCKKINSVENYYTTSSCSGRVVLMVYQEKKQNDLFCKVYHDLISLTIVEKDLKEICKKYKNKSIKFKLDPPILHVACRDMKSAKSLYEKAKIAGWKKIGLVSWEKRIILEIICTGKLEFPIIENKKLLVNKNFLKIIVKQSNSKLKNSWKKIKKLEKAIK
jgi:tRNA wybutosine-synthesizing protein 3